MFIGATRSLAVRAAKHAEILACGTPCPEFRLAYQNAPTSPDNAGCEPISSMVKHQLPQGCDGRPRVVFGPFGEWDQSVASRRRLIRAGLSSLTRIELRQPILDGCYYPVGNRINEVSPRITVCGLWFVLGGCVRGRFGILWRSVKAFAHAARFLVRFRLVVLAAKRNIIYIT